MKKKRFLSLLLSVILLLSCLIPEAFAADTQIMQCPNGYLAIGDSISRGFGSTGEFTGEVADYDQRNVTGAFTAQVAEAVGCVMPDDICDPSGNFWPLCYPGLTAAVTKDLFGIDDGYQDEAYAYDLYDEMISRFGYEDSLTGVLGEAYSGKAGVGELPVLAAKADLITVELGMNDIFGRPIFVAFREMGLGDVMTEAVDISALSAKDMAALAAKVIEGVYSGLEHLKTYYPQMLAKLREWNPDAAIVLVGAFNITADMPLLDDCVLPLGSTLSAITATVNQYYKLWAEQYHATYVDISNITSTGAARGWSIGGGLCSNVSVACHPDQDGHDYIARQVLSALTQTSTKLPKTYIQVDLERCKKVQLVTVNGRAVAYQLEGSRLTVPYYTAFARNLTVTAVNTDGKLAVQTYQLAYHGGYTAYRLYATGNAQAVVRKLLKNLFSLFRK